MILQLPTCVWANKKNPKQTNEEEEQGIMGKLDFQLRFQKAATFLSFSSLRTIYSVEGEKFHSIKVSEFTDN